MFDNIHLNTILNTALIYLFIIVGIRLLGKKELGQLSITDFIFIMLVSEVVGNAMLASNESLLGGIIAATTLMLLNWGLRLWVDRSSRFRMLMEGRPAILIRKGVLNEKLMKKNNINIEELEQACRENGISDLSTIAIAILEVDGKISILKDENFKSVTTFDQ